MTGNVFGNPQLASELYEALAHVASHYKSFDYIAAYEPLSEPRFVCACVSLGLACDAFGHMDVCFGDGE